MAVQARDDGPFPLGTEVLKKPAESIEGFVNRCLGPLDDGDLNAMRSEINDNRVLRAELKHQAELAERYQNDDPEVERSIGMTYYTAPDSGDRIKAIRKSVDDEVGLLTEDQIRTEALELRKSDREQIAHRLTLDLNPNSSLVRISDLISRYGTPGRFFVVDKDKGELGFKAEERYQIPTFIRKVKP